MEFEFVEFNPRRAARKAEAVRMNVDDGEESGWLWMSENDIRKNIMEFGQHPELMKGLAAYCSPKTTANTDGGTDK